jgi:hypothetical protein
MKEEVTWQLFPSTEAIGGGHVGRARPTAGGGLRTLLRCGRRKKKAGRFRGRRLH